MRNKTVRKICVQCQKCWGNGGEHQKQTLFKGPYMIPCEDCEATGIAAVPACELKGSGEIEMEEERSRRPWRGSLGAELEEQL